MASAANGELETLLAIEAIKALMARLVRALDARDWATYRACHAPDHVSQAVAAVPSVGVEQMMSDLMAALDGVRTIHHVHSPEIVLSSPTEARGSWALEDWLFWMQGAEEHWLHGWGFYDDTYGQRDGQWLFTSRRLTRLRVEHSLGSRRAGPDAAPFAQTSG